MGTKRGIANEMQDAGGTASRIEDVAIGVGREGYPACLPPRRIPRHLHHLETVRQVVLEGIDLVANRRTGCRTVASIERHHRAGRRGGRCIANGEAEVIDVEAWVTLHRTSGARHSGHPTAACTVRTAKRTQIAVERAVG
jgi:hypothetical protein